MNFTRRLIVEPDSEIKLSKYDPDDTFDYAHDAKLDEKLAKMLKRLDNAAMEACGADEGSLSDYKWAVHHSDCHAISLNRAVAALDAPRLTELYQARLERPGGEAYISVN